MKQNDLDFLSENLIWASDLLKNKKIFLTGGTGVFGKNLLSSFIHLNETMNLGVKCTVLARNAEAFALRNPEFCRGGTVEFISGDVRNFVFPAGEFDFVIHAATPVDNRLEKENPAEMKSIIVDGTKRVVEFANKRGAKKLLLTSSGAVYGTQPPEIKNMPEDLSSPKNPVTTYGQGKLEAENICFDGFSNSVITRHYAIIGAWLPLDIHFAAGNFIRDGLAGEQIIIESDGRPLRSYLHTSDLVVWLMTILLKGEAGRAYNVGSEQEISIGDLARLIAKQFAPYKTPLVKGEMGNDNPPRYVPSTRRAREELGLSQKISLEEGIKKTIEWYYSGMIYNESANS